MYSVTSGSAHTLFYAHSICNCTVRANIPKSIRANYFGTSTLIGVYLYTYMHICCFIFTTAAIYYSSDLPQQRFTTAAESVIKMSSPSTSQQLGMWPICQPGTLIWKRHTRTYLQHEVHRAFRSPVLPSVSLRWYKNKTGFTIDSKLDASQAVYMLLKQKSQDL